MARFNRLKKELKDFKESPPTGILCWAEEENLENIKAVIFADEDSVYESGIFKLSIEVPERYPFQPPKVRFQTKIYHPNIDTEGRICLDILKMPPAGGWRPVLNLSSVLTSIRLLMVNPNPLDPLMANIAEEYKMNPVMFEATAKDWTRKYASSDNSDETNKRKKRKNEDTSNNITFKKKKETSSEHD